MVQSRVHITSVRPLVRYVDESQAVIELHLGLHGLARGDRVEAVVQMRSPDGRRWSHRADLRVEGREGALRFEMLRPLRWWPAGLGEQPLYEATVALVRGDELLDHRELTLGLTSIRRRPDAERVLLVNGRECPIEHVVAVQPQDERTLLPVGASSLLLVRGHFGPELLFDATDRAGVLLLQAVDDEPPSTLQRQVDRLVRHPSLAGWLVDAPDGDDLARRLGSLDPTHRVFRRRPAI